MTDNAEHERTEKARIRHELTMAKSQMVVDTVMRDPFVSYLKGADPVAFAKAEAFAAKRRIIILNTPLSP